MRILLLSFYYPPDLCAGSFRTGSLVAALRERAPPRVQLDVVTTMPNRYSSFGRDAPEVEMLDGLEIHRVRLPSHDSDMAGQSRAFVRFARGAFARVRDRNYDLVFATSSRLMTAALGAWIAGAQRAPLYLDIRDIFADTIEDVLPRIVAWPVARAFSRIERWTVRRANRINLVSPGFEEYFRARYPGSALSGFTNGIDDEFLGAPLQAGRSRSDRRPVVLYAGNIGEGQALHRILPGLARELRARCRFVIIGDGGRRDALERSLAASGVDNVELRMSDAPGCAPARVSRRRCPLPASRRAVGFREGASVQGVRICCPRKADPGGSIGIRRALHPGGDYKCSRIPTV